MALKPADRYASPRALADDIEHWLADEAVTAHRDSLPARFSRATRRHKVATATVAALLLAAVAGLSIGTLLLGASRPGPMPLNKMPWPGSGIRTLFRPAQ